MATRQGVNRQLDLSVMVGRPATAPYAYAFYYFYAYQAMLEVRSSGE